MEQRKIHAGYIMLIVGGVFFLISISMLAQGSNHNRTGMAIYDNSGIQGLYMTFSFLAYLSFVISGIIFIKHAKKMQNEKERKLWMVFSVCLFIFPLVSIFILPFALTSGKKENNTVSINADELLKYKTMLDNGIITEEEFATKKNQLLS